MGNPGTNKSPSPEKREAKTSQDRLSEATSEKTVSDLEESEKISDSTPNRPSDDTSVPSPDGMLDEADGIKDAGPI